MTTSNKIVVGIVSVAVLVVGFILGTLGAHKASVSSPTSQLGATSYDVTNAAGGIRIGTNGSYTSKEIKGTCTLTSYSSLVASSTIMADCSAPGVVSTDRINVMLNLSASRAISGPGGFGSILVYASSASTTAGHINVGLLNLTGAATSSYPLASTSVKYSAYAI